MKKPDWNLLPIGLFCIRPGPVAGADLPHRLAEMLSEEEKLAVIGVPSSRAISTRI